MRTRFFGVVVAVGILASMGARTAESSPEVAESEMHGDDPHGGSAHGADAHGGSAHGADPHGGGHAAEHHDPSLHFNFTNLSYRGKDELGGEFGDNRTVTADGQVSNGEEPMSPPFVFLVLNFALLIAILVKYLWPAAGKLAEERHTQIKGALEEAAKLREQAKQKLAEYEVRIKDVDREIKELIDGIRADAEADKARILEAATAQAAQMKKDADQRIAAEIELARAQLTKEVTAAASHAAEKLLKDKTTVEDQRNLVSSFISGISGAN